MGGAFEQESGDIGGGATGVFELTVTNSAIVGNTANSDGAGGLDTEDDATITIDHSTVSGNSGGLAGGVGSFTENTTFSANGSTFSGNTSSSAGSAVLGSGTYTFVNSTITGNTEGAFGAVTVDGALSLVHVTMTNNTSLGELEPDALSSRGLGALAEDDDAANIVTDSLTSADSVVAQPLGAVNCAAGEPKMAAAAVSSTDGGYNFSDDTSCGFVAPDEQPDDPERPGARRTGEQRRSHPDAAAARGQPAARRHPDRSVRGERRPARRDPSAGHRVRHRCRRGRGPHAGAGHARHSPVHRLTRSSPSLRPGPGSGAMTS